MAESKFDIVMKIHNYVPFRLLRAISSHWMNPSNIDMPKCVINVTSTSGLHGAMGQVNYATAKAGIVGLTKTVAVEWSRYVRSHFNAILEIESNPNVFFLSLDTTYAPMPWLTDGLIPASRALRRVQKCLKLTATKSPLEFL